MSVPVGVDGAGPGTEVTRVAESIPFGVGLIGIVGERAVVEGVAYAIAVGIGAVRAGIAGVSDAIPVAVRLIRIGDRRAIVAGVPHPVAVAVGLVGIACVRTVVAAHSHTAADAVAVRIAAADRGHHAGERARARVAVGTAGACVLGKAVEQAGGRRCARRRHGDPHEREHQAAASTPHIDPEVVAARAVEEGERRSIREGNDQRLRVADTILRRRHRREAHVVQEEVEGVGAGATAVGMVDGEGDGGRRDASTRRGGERTTQQGGKPQAQTGSTEATHGISSRARSLIKNRASSRGRRSAHLRATRAGRRQFLDSPARD